MPYYTSADYMTPITHFLTFTALTLLLIVVAVAAYIAGYYLRNPFEFPYFRYNDDVSNRRNVDILDEIDEFLINDANWEAIQLHQRQMVQWQRRSIVQASESMFSRHRQEQLDQVIDVNAYLFYLVRQQTHYSQCNYVKTPYKVAVPQKCYACTYAWLMDRRRRLEDIGCETTLRKYHSSQQRSLMTDELRKQIKERDNYTCQMCGRYMPDGFGLEIDHIVPVSKGGKTVPSNLQVLCSRCNASKGAR